MNAEGRRFQNMDDIKANSSHTLKAISNEFIQDCFKKLKTRLGKICQW